MKNAQIKTETVKVAIRVRPMNTKEKNENSTICVEVDKTNNQISVLKTDCETRTFQYDYVYAPNSTQRAMYDDVAFPVVESIFQGYNGTIFAYGQTGCGKTYTMMGDYNIPELRGIIPNAFSHIFGYINSEGNSKRFLIRCSFLEIYNEEIRDLLGADCNKKLEAREDPKKGIFVKDLNIKMITTPKEIDEAMTTGHRNRHTGETSMNSESSRSHCIFTVYLEIEESSLENENNKKIKAGKLNLVDLAGSERQSKSKSEGKTFDEAKKINLSLTALSNVIDALSSNRQHIPYRDSKLTRLLQDSLGGNTKTVMIAAVSPSSFNYEETLGTLRYAARANAIKNAPRVNEDPKDALLRQYEEQIRLLKEQLEGRGNFTLPQDATSTPTPTNLNQFIIKGNTNNDAYVQFEAERLKMENFIKEKDMQLESNQAEKDQMVQRIKELERKIINGDDDIENSEKEKKKFKDYRQRQLKNEEESRKKNQILEEMKRQEEENLLNDANKLRNKIKYLEGEISDLKYENEKDRTDFLESVKDINKENALYKGILKMILSDTEIKKIIEMSKYCEDNEEWKIHPFSLREKVLKLPNIRPYQVADFVENEINSRDLVFDDNQDLALNQRNNKFTDISTKKEPMRETKKNFLKKRGSFRKEENLNVNDGDVLFMNNNGIPVHNKNIQLDPLRKKSDKKLIIINRKEAKKYEEILKNVNVNVNNIHSINPDQIIQTNISQSKPKIVGKVILDPIPIFRNNAENTNMLDNRNINMNVNMNSNASPLPVANMNKSKSNFYMNQNQQNNNNKMEVCFKATLQFTDSTGINNINNQIEITPNINLNNVSLGGSNRKNNRLEKIPDSKFMSRDNQN